MADAGAWSSRDPVRIAQAVLQLLDGFRRDWQAIALVLLLVGTILWTLLGAWGRTHTLNRLEKSGVSLRTILALQGLRALFIWLAGVALAVGILFDERVATRGAKPDLILYFALAAWTVILIGGLWSIVNWYLSLAAVCCAKNAGGFGRSIRQAVALTRSHSGDLMGLSLVFSLWRLIVFAVAFVLWFLPSGMMATAPKAYFAWLMVTTLAYFAASDAVYIARMAGYLTIDPLDSNDEETGTSRPNLSGNQSMPL
jgi:hypothetical protein